MQKGARKVVLAAATFDAFFTSEIAKIGLTVALTVIRTTACKIESALTKMQSHKDASFPGGRPFDMGIEVE